MDLIYANEKKEDIGVLMDYTFDLAFGKDENNFACEVYSSNHVCREEYMLYIEGTEYGGIIDKVKADTSSETITYSGRTWHGILAGKIIGPDAGEDYLILSGEANQIIAFLIERTGLTGIFRASTRDSGIEIVEYPVRYQDAYTVLRKMLFEATGKLKIQYRKDIVELSAVPYIDYSQDEEWDSSQMDFQAEQNHRPVNHLICLGTGNLKDRHVIHLFTDENGGVQPYALSDVPLSDTDYILDTSAQILCGEDEVAELYDCSNAAVTENYIRLSQLPSGWEKTYGNYYQQEENGSYKALESWEEDVYTLQKIQPYDWNTNYTDYYKQNGTSFSAVSSYSSTVYTAQTAKPADWSRKYAQYFKKSGSSYKEVEAEVAESYRKQTKKPVNWKKNYGSYFYYYSDGVTAEYRAVSGITKYRYLPQTMKPTDWDDNFHSYYRKKKDAAGYTEVEGTGTDHDTAPKWKAKKYYTKESYSVAPTWDKNTYYTQKKTSSAPVWTAGVYYTKSIQEVPAWTAGTYYTKSRETFIPEFIPDTYFEKRIDNYAELVAGGLKRLEESYNCNSISATLDPENVYDIGDIVGATEEVTGISVWQPITKKIVTIKEDKEEIQYEIGE